MNKKRVFQPFWGFDAMLNKVVNWGHCESSHSVGSFKAVFFL